MQLSLTPSFKMIIPCLARQNISPDYSPPHWHSVFVSLLAPPLNVGALQKPSAHTSSQPLLIPLVISSRPVMLYTSYQLTIPKSELWSLLHSKCVQLTVQLASLLNIKKVFSTEYVPNRIQDLPALPTLGAKAAPTLIFLILANWFYHFPHYSSPPPENLL